VSLALLITGNLAFMDFLFYIIFQALGGLAAGLMVWVMLLQSPDAKDATKASMNIYSPTDPNKSLYLNSFPGVDYVTTDASDPVKGGIDIGKYVAISCFAEFFATFFLVFMVFGTAVDKRAPASAYGFAIGGVVGMSAIGIGRFSGAALNPTRWLGPAIVGLWASSSTYQVGAEVHAKSGWGWIAYIICTSAGGAVAGLMYKALFLKD